MRILRYIITQLSKEELFKLRVMDAYSQMQPKNARYLCRLFGIGKSTFYRWKLSYKPYNLSSLKYKSRKPKRLKFIDWSVVMEICEWKRQKGNRKKSHHYLYQLWLKQGRTPPCSPKTIYNWWKRRGLIEVRHRRKRRSTKLFNQASVPGKLVQFDTKYLEGRKRFQYTAIDVVSKWRALKVYNKLNEANSVDFVNTVLTKAQRKGIQIKLIQTDNGKKFQTQFRAFLEEKNIKHQYTWIHTPDQNGVVERSHRTDEEEFYQENETSHLTTEELNKKMQVWEEYYNTERLHFTLNFDTPNEYLEKHQVSQM